MHEEPFHKPLHEEGIFKYLNVFSSPGDTTAMHSHRLPILYMCISGSEVWLDKEGADQRQVNLPTGCIGSDMYSDSTVFNNRIAVIGDSGLYTLTVERIEDFEHGGLQFAAEPIFAENGFEVYSLSGENLHDSGKDQDCLSAFAKWPAVVFECTAVLPSDKKRPRSFADSGRRCRHAELFRRHRVPGGSANRQHRSQRAAKMSPRAFHTAKLNKFEKIGPAHAAMPSTE